VSDSGPEDPFRGVPFLSDLMKMIQGQGAFSWEAARQFAIAVASEGESEPNVDPLARIDLEQLIRVAELHVAQATGLNPSGSGRPLEALPVTRALWAHQTIEAYRPLFEDLAAALSASGDPDQADEDPSADFFGGLMKMLTPMMLGVTAGSMVGHLAQRAFGQYDLPIPRAASHQLLVVPTNLDRFAGDWSLPIEDLRLWVCLSEVTTHAVLNVPHVRARMTDLMREFVSSYQPDPRALEDRLGGFDLGDPQSMAGLQSAFADPEVLLGATRSPAQDALVPQLDALVALVVGVTDHVMDNVGAKVLSSYGMLTEALRRRRVESDPSDGFVSRLLGLTLTREQVQRGSTFVDGVVERAGQEGLARLWASASELPTPAEIDAPGLWLARIDL
jgi:putative hydrolase